MEVRRNDRRFDERVAEGKHLTVEEMRNMQVPNGYLHLDLPPYPKPEFHLFYVSHDTNKAGLRGISKDKGFGNPNKKSSLVWWSLVVTPEHIESAENRLLEATYPDRTEEQRQAQPTFLAKFATSEAFTETSRLGNFRFTFPLREVLEAYSEQFCSGGKPAMRVYRTTLYSAEVCYAVLVHSPEHNQRFADLPLLTDDSSSVCGYNGEMGYIIWKAEAMCANHKYQLVKNDLTKQMTAEERPQGDKHPYFVWDNVALAFYVPKKVLTFDHETLGDKLTITKKSRPAICREDLGFERALVIIQELWPDYQPREEIPDEDTKEKGQDANPEAEDELTEGFRLFLRI